MPQISPPHTIAQLAFLLIPSPSLSLFALFVILSVWPAVTLAEVRVVTAQGEHRMGDRDTREDAIRLATEAAKRNALEQVAVYLESITIVDGLDVTKDEIRTYTAGLVLVLEQETNTTLDGDTIVVHTDLVAQIDTEEVRQAIAALRENEDARHQLVALQQENDQLQQDPRRGESGLGTSLDHRADTAGGPATPRHLESGAIERHGLASLDGLGARLAGWLLFFFLGGVGPDSRLS